MCMSTDWANTSTTVQYATVRGKNTWASHTIPISSSSFVYIECVCVLWSNVIHAFGWKCLSLTCWQHSFDFEWMKTHERCMYIRWKRVFTGIFLFFSLMMTSTLCISITRALRNIGRLQLNACRYSGAKQTLFTSIWTIHYTCVAVIELEMTRWYHRWCWMLLSVRYFLPFIAFQFLKFCCWICIVWIRRGEWR